MYKCAGKKSKMTPYEALSDDTIVAKILEYIKSKPSFFTSQNEIVNIESALRNSFSWCRKVANFPAKEARRIYFRYNDINGEKINCLDTSMGFGSRMSAVLLSGHNYCGFDPNIFLFSRLKKYKQFLIENNILSQTQKCGLYSHGSEVYDGLLENTFDVSFTSPPYFNLETYGDDNYSSSKNYHNYSMWVKEFVQPTVINTCAYLKNGGYAMINIKNLNKKETCFDDFFESFSKINYMHFIETFNFTITKKQYGKQYNDTKGVINNTEPVMVFQKIL